MPSFSLNTVKLVCCGVPFIPFFGVVWGLEFSPDLLFISKNMEKTPQTPSSTVLRSEGDIVTTICPAGSVC